MLGNVFRTLARRTGKLSKRKIQNGKLFIALTCLTFLKLRTLRIRLLFGVHIEAEMASNIFYGTI